MNWVVGELLKVLRCLTLKSSQMKVPSNQLLIILKMVTISHSSEFESKNGLSLILCNSIVTSFFLIIFCFDNDLHICS